MGKRESYRLNTDIFIRRSMEVHGSRYDYTNTVYTNKRSKVRIVCPIHGEFQQIAYNHMKGQGCPECGKKYAAEYRKGNWVDFVRESENRFGGTYSFPYIENEYENSHSRVTVKCGKCGNVFVKIACDHLTSPHGGCLSCYANTSYEEKELSDYIVSLVGADNVVLRDRTLLNGREIDIYIPSRNIAVEYDGLYWHSDAVKTDKYYHLSKTEGCLRKGVRLIHVFEDEFVNRKRIVKEKLRHILGCVNRETRVMGRKCTVRPVTKKEASLFLETNHIQGFVSSSVYVGCFYADKIVGVMTFKKEKRVGFWELTRFATENGSVCCGVGGKLFTWFVREYDPFEVKSFADRRWSDSKSGNLYAVLGFSLEKTLLPDYRYVVGNTFERYHKFGFRKSILHKKYGLPTTMTEREMAEAINAHRIYDCGLLKYVWKKFKHTI